jgi:hypothetical protein
MEPDVSITKTIVLVTTEEVETVAAAELDAELDAGMRADANNSRSLELSP